MYSLKINELKKLLENIYNGYLSESTKSKSIIELGKFFNIEVYEERTNDYKVLNIDVDNLYIEILDEKYGTIYKSFYTENCDLFNYYGNILRFIIVQEISNERYLEKVYHIGENKPVITKMIFEEDGCVLEFEKEESTSEDTFLDNGKKLTIRYLKCNKYGIYEPLLTRIVKVNDGDSFEKTYTYSDTNKSKENNCFNKSTYVVSNSVIYSVNEVSFDKPISYLKGICFESINIDINRYMPYGIEIRNHKRLSSKDTLSAIIFNGIIENNFHLLEIYKDRKYITVSHIVQNNMPDDLEVKEVSNESIELPVIYEGYISINELYRVIDSFDEKDEFIQMVLSDILFFIKKIYIKNGLVEEEFDPLSPRLLLNKDFDLISTAIARNKSEYFRFIDEQFKSKNNVKVK